ncbi:MAG: M1 family metallopeptidase [Candidatus Obscuribacterales bacterium]
MSHLMLSSGCHHAQCRSSNGAHAKALSKAEAAAPENNVFRLPRTVVPSHYDLTITPGPESRLFDGTVAIDVAVLKPVSVVKINAKNLVITSAQARHASGTVLKGTVTLDADKEMADIAFDGTLAASAWVLELQFAGQHGNNGQGFFANTYEDAEKNVHTVLCTQFESADARSAFPCFDEPEFKATFKVRLVVANELVALSNGDVVGVTPSADNPAKKVVEFEETLKISTYVVCFVVGRLACTAPFYVNGKRMQIWSIPGTQDQHEFAKQAAAFGIDYFENYFEVPYPFGNKIDLVAIPDFAWGGMENVGLIVFQPRLLLVDKNSSDSKKNEVCQIIMHEIAHQWFGDLVTMRWWNGLWLNESFATFMQYKAADAFNSKWACWDSFCYKRDKAYWTDSVRASHPIEETVERPGDAILLVDAISYEKGCSVLYQTENLIGAEVLRQGIAQYLKKHAFGNTESFDLWESLEAACRANQIDLPIRSIMEAWIFQVGHPEVMVTVGKKPGELVLTQRPFLLLEKGRKAHKRWPIPITMAVTAADGTVSESKFVLFERTKRLNVGAGYKLVKVNSGGFGFYRVRYAPELLALLTDNLKDLAGIELANLVADAKAFFTACLIDAGEYLRFLFKIAECNDAFSWHHVIEGLDLVSRLCDDKDRRALSKVVLAMLSDLADSQGWDLSPTSETLLPVFSGFKPYHLNLNPLVRKLSGVFYRDWRKSAETVEPFKAAQAAMVLHFAGAKVVPEFSALQRQAMHATPLHIQQYLLQLDVRHGAVGKVGKIGKVGKSAKAGTGGKADIFAVLANIILSPGRSAESNVQRFLEEWPETISPETPPIQVVYKVLYSGIVDVDTADLEAQLKRCFRRYKSHIAQSAINRTMERIRANVVMREKQSAAIKALCKTLVKDLRNRPSKAKLKLFKVEQ